MILPYCVNPAFFIIPVILYPSLYHTIRYHTFGECDYMSIVFIFGFDTTHPWKSGDGCELASTLCKCDLRKGDLFVLSLGNGATSEAGKYLFRVTNVRIIYISVTKYINSLYNVYNIFLWISHKYVICLS